MATGKIELIDRDALIEVLSKCVLESLESVQDIIYSQPVVAVATPRFEVEMQIC